MLVTASDLGSISTIRTALYWVGIANETPHDASKTDDKPSLSKSMPSRYSSL
jgi:hypothetical protein